MPLVFDRKFEAPYGEIVRVSDLVLRLLAPNPGPFTFRGTSVTIVGTDQVAVIDPGPDDPVHLQALRKALDARQVSHILVTHTHRDHSPAARHVKDWTGAPMFGFGPHAKQYGAPAEEGPDLNFVPDVELRDGDVVEGKGFTLRCVHTPGHTSNHLCYALEEEKALFCGDHVMGWSTTVVAPPDGNMAAYMRSLERILARDDRILWPTHGGAIRTPRVFVAALLQHRVDREAQTVAALEAGLRRIPEITERLYSGLDPRLKRAAECNVLAHVMKLVEEGRVQADGAGMAAVYAPRG